MSLREPKKHPKSFLFLGDERSGSPKKSLHKMYIKMQTPNSNESLVDIEIQTPNPSVDVAAVVNIQDTLADQDFQQKTFLLIILDLIPECNIYSYNNLNLCHLIKILII
jgi:hypothetical protein